MFEVKPKVFLCPAQLAPHPVTPSHFPSWDGPLSTVWCRTFRPCKQCTNNIYCMEDMPICTVTIDVSVFYIHGIILHILCVDLLFFLNNIL